MATPPLVTVEVARQLFRNDEPFQIRLSQANRSTNTDKWWSIVWDGRSHLCDVNHGRRGSMGRKTPFRKTVGDGFNKALLKLSEGYQYSAQTSRTLPKTSTPSPPPALTGLLSEIRALYQIARDHYQAYDENNNLLMDVNAATATRIHAANSFQISLTNL